MGDNALIKLFCALFIALSLLISTTPTLGATNEAMVDENTDSLPIFPGENGSASGETGREASRLGFKEFAKDTGQAYIGLWLGRFFYVRNKNSRIFDTSPSKWWDNITTKPQFDDGDDYFTNYINHPMFGAFFYLYYRARGHGALPSALGSVALSTLWEYTIEGLVEPASLVDLILTPGLGVPFGIGLDYASNLFLEKQSTAAKIIGYLLNPTRILVNGRKTGLLNPLTGTYAIIEPFELNENKAQNLKFAYPFFTESPYPFGRGLLNFEIINLEKDLGGEFLFYYFRTDFVSKSGVYSLYGKFPYGGVNNVNIEDKSLSSGFELGNIMIGNKLVMHREKNFILTAGFDFYLPTIRKDNLRRLEAITSFTRELPMFLRDSFTPSPYIAAGASFDRLLIQGILGSDFIMNADRFEGNFFEYRIRYGLSLATRSGVWTSPALFTEVNGYSLLTSSKTEKTDLVITPGLRFGTRYSPGFGVQLPVLGQSSKVAKISFVIDFQVRF